MATYAIGDIHGCLTSLTTLIQVIELNDDDVLITLGDYVDRGPDTKRCLDYLIDLKARHDVHCLRGNHEVMMLGARDSKGSEYGWLGVGGKETLESYGTTELADVPASHWDFINSTMPYLETDSHIFVHAGIDPLIPMVSQSEWDLFWEFFDHPAPHVSGKTMICGHSSQKSGLPLSIGHAICIDTFVYGGAWLTCLNVETNHFIQANETGQIRKDIILPN